nr:hypothetical protein [Tolivirales sp.]
MKMSTKVVTRPLGFRQAAAVLSTPVESFMKRQRARVFYHYRRVATAWKKPLGPESPIIKGKGRQVLLESTKSNIARSNRFEKLRDFASKTNNQGLDLLEEQILTAPISETADLFTDRDQALLEMRTTGLIKDRGMFRRRRSLPAQTSYGFSDATQTESHTTSTQISREVDDKGITLDMDTTMFIPKRKAVNKLVNNKRHMKVCSRLLNHLRCKYHLTLRDKSLPARLVHEARTWLIKAGHTCETDLDYAVLSSAVSAAFMVSDEELEFRSRVKNKQNYENMYHLNETLQGNLGKSAFPLRNGGSLLRNLMFDNKLPTTNVTL